MSKGWAALLVLPCAVLPAGCWSNSVTVSDDVKLIQLHGSTWALTDENSDMLVGPRVTAIICKETIAWGSKDGASYFIIDLRSNDVEQGISQRRLDARLRDFGVTFAEPHKVSSLERSFSGCG
ncbi:hypothetical protein EH31_12845 [Erythrobacter longus]|uniref:Uncharacterized protein n=1 Tax=Erythrobacter longus TaxID=1044 RepID=A0A074M4E6_ERYLO|nr:hypothetical protein EH31_12845 [Erythrobacter longus]